MTQIRPFSALLPNPRLIADKSAFLREVKIQFRALQQQGVLTQQPKPAFYVYRVYAGNRSHTGLLTLFHLEDYERGRIRVHEHTLSSREANMAQLFQERQAHLKPLLVGYPNVLEIDAYINRLTMGVAPHVRLQAEHEVHQFWVVDQPHHITRLAELFSKYVPAAYIADGHHRAKTAANMRREMSDGHPEADTNEWFHYLPAVFFPASELDIHDYNRVVTSIAPYTGQQLLEKLERVFKLQRIRSGHRPEQPGCIHMYLQHHWYQLTLPPGHAYINGGISDRIDAQLLNQLVFQDILHIEDVRNSQAIKYVQGPKGGAALKKAADETQGAAFWLYPLPLEQLIAVADANGVLPPKSTWFEPRMRSGLAIAAFGNHIL